MAKIRAIEKDGARNNRFEPVTDMAQSKRAKPSRNAGREYCHNYKDKWNSEKFMSLTPKEHSFLDYLESGPASNAIGCYKASYSRLKDEYLHLNRGQFKKLFDACLSKKLFQYDDQNKVIYLRKYIRNNPPHNPNAVLIFANCFKKLPDKCRFKFEVYDAIEKECFDSTASMTDTFEQRFVPLASYMVRPKTPSNEPINRANGNGKQPQNHRNREKPMGSTPPSITESTNGSINGSNGLKANRGNNTYCKYSSTDKEHAIPTPNQLDREADSGEVDVEGLLGGNPKFDRLPSREREDYAGFEEPRF